MIPKLQRKPRFVLQVSIPSLPVPYGLAPTGALARNTTIRANVGHRDQYLALWAVPRFRHDLASGNRPSPYTTQLTDLSSVGTRTHQPLTRHAIVPHSFRVKVFPVLTGRVRCCFDHFAPVDASSEAETSFATWAH